MKRTIKKLRFVWAHGKHPRGYGFWMFEDADMKITFAFYGFYSDAAKAALRAPELKGKEIFVAP